MALRTIDRASSRRVTITGGGLRPMRCMAASRPEIDPCRCSSVPRSCRSCVSQFAQPRLDEAELALALLDQLRSLHQPLGDALAFGRDLVDVGLQLFGATLRGLQAAAVRVQALAGFVGIDGALGNDECGQGRCGGNGQRRRRSASSACGPRFAKSLAPEAAARPRPRRIASTARQIYAEFPVKDHTNCGMGELRCRPAPLSIL